MDIKQIEQMWDQDCKIDLTDLSQTTADTALLHNKYYKILNSASRELAGLEGEKNRLILIKADYYTGNIDHQTLKENGWKPFPRLILKNELAAFIQADPDMINVNLKISEIKQVIKYLESIIQTLNFRHLSVKNIIEDRKFLNG